MSNWSALHFCVVANDFVPFFVFSSPLLTHSLFYYLFTLPSPFLSHLIIYSTGMRKCRKTASIWLVASQTGVRSLFLPRSGCVFALSCWNCSRLTRKPSGEPPSTHLATLQKPLGEPWNKYPTCTVQPQIFIFLGYSWDIWDSLCVLKKCHSSRAGGILEGVGYSSVIIRGILRIRLGTSQDGPCGTGYYSKYVRLSPTDKCSLCYTINVLLIYYLMLCGSMWLLPVEQHLSS